MASAQKSYDARGHQRVTTFPTATGQTINQGDFVCVNSSGLIIAAASAGSDVGAVSGNLNAIVGRAVENILRFDGSYKTSIGVMIAEPGTEFKLPLYSATPANAVPVPTQLGSGFELRNANSPFSGYAVNLDATTNKVVRIVDFETESYTGWPATSGSTAGTTQYAMVWVAIIPAATLVGAH